MTLPDLLARCAVSHVHLGLGSQPGVVRVFTTNGALPADILAGVAQHKAALLGLLGASKPRHVAPKPAATATAFPSPSRGSPMPVQPLVQTENGQVDHRVIRDAETLQKLVDELLADPMATVIAVDAEWHGSYPEAPGAYLRTIQVSWRAGCAACVVLRAAGGLDAFAPNPAAAILHLARLLTSTADRSVRIVGHFFRADLPWLIHAGLDLRSKFCGIGGGQLQPSESPTDAYRLAGGFDTGLAAHAHDETAALGLKSLATRLAGVPNYDADLQAWRDTNKHIEGFGDCPEDILLPYSNWDADATRRLYDVYGRPGGLLDRDPLGNSSRRAFQVAMSATAGILEMEMTGIKANAGRLNELAEVFRTGRDRLLMALRNEIGWPGFNPASPQQCRELLFGERFIGKTDPATGAPVSARPTGAITLGLSPVRTTGKPARAWASLRSDAERARATPAADKETLGVLAQQSPVAAMLRDLRFLEQPLKGALRPAAGPTMSGSSLAGHLRVDGRIHTSIRQVTETGRYSSSNPPLQNISQRREADYRRILGDNYLYPIRSVFEASPGHVLVEADYVGAELAAMAWLSGDAAMIEHVRRNALPETDPDYYDIHSHVAVAAFRLDCPSSKAGLKQAGKSHLRTVAKSVIFGIAYGRGAKAIAQAAAEEGIPIETEEAQAIINAIFTLYPGLKPFFDACRQRVKHPRWLQNSFGRLRRFPIARSVPELGGFEREAMNFPVQSLIADAVSLAIANLVRYRQSAEGVGLNYRLLLQIHDAVLLETPIGSVETLVDHVLPRCLSELVPIWPCSPAGVRTGRGPYHLGIDVKVALQWGTPLTAAAAALGLPPRLAGL